MNTLEFLEAVWPAEGIYCLVAQPGWQHKTFTSIADAAAAAERVRDKKDVYFAVHTLKQHWVPDPSKGEDGKAWRTHANMAECRCFFFDLDVGEGKNKYATREEALNGLDQFLFATRLPSPMVTSSGGGFHLYWRLSESLPSDEWRRHAFKLYYLARKHGLRCDPSRTTDQSSVLRVAGTFNHKSGGRRPVLVLHDGVCTHTREFVGELERLAPEVEAPAEVKYPRAAAMAEGNLQRVWDGPVSTLDELAECCEHVRGYRETGYTEGGYVAFYHLGCGIIPFVEDGEKLSHDLAMMHPRCTDGYASETRATYMANTNSSPSSCATLDAKCGGDACGRCPFAPLGKNPLLIASALRKLKATPPPPPPGPVVDISPLRDVEPEYPYTRTAAGLSVKVKKPAKDGVDVETAHVFCPYGFFSFDVCERTDLEQSFSLWDYQIPLVEGERRIKIPSGLLQDDKALHRLLLDHGINISRKQATTMSDYLTHYMGTLQRHKAANKQYDHLGWVDETMNEFILPTAVLGVDGSEKPCSLSAVARGSSDFVKQAGDLETQVKLMQFYNQPEYLPHQFVVLCGLGSPLFQASEEHGVVINASGESGGSKSTALYTAASLWGYPKDYVINGTEGGATALRRLETIHTLSNLPVCIDEITKMDPETAQNFVFGSSQKKARERLKNDGTPRAARGGYKSTMVLCSSNTSLHDTLGINNRAGVAVNMRVFEMSFPPVKAAPTAGTAFLHQLNRNYGHIGPAFMKLYMADRVNIDEAVRQLADAISKKCQIVGSERFWVYAMACALMAGSIAYKAGLLPFDLNPIRNWLVDEQLPLMRGEVQAEHTSSSPSSLLASFLNDKSGQTIILQPAVPGASEAWVQRPPSGEIVAHHDQDKRIVIVRKDKFRDWCVARHKNGLHTMADLVRMGIVVRMDHKFALGQGTPYAIARSVCFTVDLSHPEIAAAHTPSKVVPLHKSTGKKEVEV